MTPKRHICLYFQSLSGDWHFFAPTSYIPSWDIPGIFFQMVPNPKLILVTSPSLWNKGRKLHILPENCPLLGHLAVRQKCRIAANGRSFGTFCSFVPPSFFPAQFGIVADAWRKLGEEPRLLISLSLVLRRWRGLVVSVDSSPTQTPPWVKWRLGSRIRTGPLKPHPWTPSIHCTQCFITHYTQILGSDYH